MRARGRWVAIAAACALVALQTASAAEAKPVRYSGKTEQGKRVVLITNAKGKAQRFSIDYQGKCQHRRIRRATSVFVAPFRQADYQGFEDSGRRKERYPKYGTTGKLRARLIGVRVSRNRLRGTFDYKARYFDHGEQFNSCRARNVRWSVSR